MNSGRGGHRDGAGRPKGTTKEDAMREQLSLNCEASFKQRVKDAAKRAGFRRYSAWLRLVIEAALESEKISLTNQSDDPIVEMLDK